MSETTSQALHNGPNVNPTLQTAMQPRRYQDRSKYTFVRVPEAPEYKKSWHGKMMLAERDSAGKEVEK